MLVVHVRHMGMRVPKRLVLVEMRVRLAGRVERAVVVLVVLVVKVRMSVRHRLMNMFVLMPFGEV